MYQWWTPAKFYSSKHDLSSNTLDLFLKLSSLQICMIWNHSISSSYEEDTDFCSFDEEKKTKNYERESESDEL